MPIERTGVVVEIFETPHSGGAAVNLRWGYDPERDEWAENVSFTMESAQSIYDMLGDALKVHRLLPDFRGCSCEQCVGEWVIAPTAKS